MPYRSNIDLDGTATLLSRPDQKLLLTTHAKPDGDAYGAVVALAKALRQQNPQVQAILMAPVPANFQCLKGKEMVSIFEDGQPVAPPDLVVVLDTGAWSQLEPMRPLLEPLTDRMLIIDHHLSGDVEARHRYIDHTAPACCLIVARLLELMKLSTDQTIREALFVGLASDTGWFRFSNATAEAHELAAALKRQGVDHAALHRQLEQTERAEKLALLSRALDSLKLLAGDRAAVMTLTAGDFANTGALLEETERFVDQPQVVEAVELVVLITEPPASSDNHNTIRLSFRSKPGPDAVDVAEIARGFGGGGHARAAGAKVAAPLAEVAANVETVITKAMG